MVRSLEEFDFPFQPSLSAARIRELAELGFLARAENVVFVGRPGVGKSHLSIALALRACQARKRVLFMHATDLLEQLLAAEVSHNLGKLVENLDKHDLVVVDEVGYTAIDAHQANLFFQVVSHMYTRASLIVTNNVSFENWGKVFGGDEVIASVILARLLHFSHVSLITGPSYRMKGKSSRRLTNNNILVMILANAQPRGGSVFRRKSGSTLKRNQQSSSNRLPNFARGCNWSAH